MVLLQASTHNQSHLPQVSVNTSWSTGWSISLLSAQNTQYIKTENHWNQGVWPCILGEKLHTKCSLGLRTQNCTRLICLLAQVNTLALLHGIVSNQATAQPCPETPQQGFLSHHKSRPLYHICGTAGSCPGIHHASHTVWDVTKTHLDPAQIWGGFISIHRDEHVPQSRQCLNHSSNKFVL